MLFRSNVPCVHFPERKEKALERSPLAEIARSQVVVVEGDAGAQRRRPQAGVIAVALQATPFYDDRYSESWDISMGSNAASISTSPRA